MCLKWKPEPPSGPSRLAVGIRWVFKLILCDTATLLMQQMLHYLILCIKGATSPNTSCFDVCVSPSQECFCWGCPTWHHKGYLARQSRPSVWVWNFSPSGLVFGGRKKEHKSRLTHPLKLPAFELGKKIGIFAPFQERIQLPTLHFQGQKMWVSGFGYSFIPGHPIILPWNRNRHVVRSKALANSNKTAGGWNGGGKRRVGLK